MIKKHKKNNVRKQRDKLIAKRDLINLTLNALQENCLHENVKYKYRATVGNYDSSVDYYWIDWNCDDCGKSWQSPQEKTHLDLYPNAIRIY